MDEPAQSGRIINCIVVAAAEDLNLIGSRATQVAGATLAAEALARQVQRDAELVEQSAGVLDHALFAFFEQMHDGRPRRGGFTSIGSSDLC